MELSLKIVNGLFLTLSWRKSLSYRNQSIYLQSKSMDWFLYDNGLRHERVLTIFTKSLYVWVSFECASAYCINNKTIIHSLYMAIFWGLIAIYAGKMISSSTNNHLHIAVSPTAYKRWKWSWSIMTTVCPITHANFAFLGIVPAIQVIITTGNLY